MVLNTCLTLLELEEVPVLGSLPGKEHFVAGFLLFPELKRLFFLGETPEKKHTLTASCVEKLQCQALTSFLAFATPKWA